MWLDAVPPTAPAPHCWPVVLVLMIIIIIIHTHTVHCNLTCGAASVAAVAADAHLVLIGCAVVLCAHACVPVEICGAACVRAHPAAVAAII